MTWDSSQLQNNNLKDLTILIQQKVFSFNHGEYAKKDNPLAWKRWRSHIRQGLPLADSHNILLCDRNVLSRNLQIYAIHRILLLGLDKRSMYISRFFYSKSHRYLQSKSIHYLVHRMNTIVHWPRPCSSWFSYSSLSIGWPWSSFVIISTEETAKALFVHVYRNIKLQMYNYIIWYNNNKDKDNQCIQNSSHHIPPVPSDFNPNFVSSFDFHFVLLLYPSAFQGFSWRDVEHYSMAWTWNAQFPFNFLHIPSWQSYYG